MWVILNFIKILTIEKTSGKVRVHDDTSIEAGIIEKDYEITLFFKQIETAVPDIIFKGSTSLSKCYKLINRFSDDNELNITAIANPTEGQSKRLKSNTVSIIDKFGFTLTKIESTRNRMSFNKYIVDYDSVLEAGYLKEDLVIEISVYFRTYPHNLMSASRLIYAVVFIFSTISLIFLYAIGD